MKKTILSTALIFLSSQSFAQNIFLENFETTTNLSASGWIFYNDNHTLNNGYDSIFTNAWEIVDWAEETPNKAVSTTSAFNEQGPADRWLVSPAITIAPNAVNTSLTFKARSFDAFPHQDGFKLKISTTTNSKSGFITTLLSVPNTPNTLIEQIQNTVVDLSAYAGQTVYLAWIDDFEGGNILAIDDIQISANNLSISEINTTYVTIHPNPNQGNFKINSSNAFTAISIFDVLGKLVYTEEVNPINEINLSTNLTKGIYFLKIDSDNHTSKNQKIIID